MNNEWHPCRYVDCKLEHDGSWVDGKWYEWEDIYGNREVARMKLDAMDHFYPNTKIIKEENVRRYREIMEGENSLFDTNILPGNEYFVGGYYTRIKTHVEDHITVVDSGRLVSMSIIPEHNVADENLKVRRVEPNAEN